MTFTLPAKVRQVLYVVLAVAGLAVPFAESRGWISASEWQQVLTYASTLGFTVAAAKVTPDALPAEATLYGDHDASILDDADPEVPDDPDDGFTEPVTQEA